MKEEQTQLLFRTHRIVFTPFYAMKNLNKNTENEGGHIWAAAMFM